MYAEHNNQGGSAVSPLLLGCITREITMDCILQDFCFNKICTVLNFQNNAFYTLPLNESILLCIWYIIHMDLTDSRGASSSKPVLERMIVIKCKSHISSVFWTRCSLPSCNALPPLYHSPRLLHIWRNISWKLLRGGKE